MEKDIKEFKIKFLGVRGSYPVSSTDMNRYGGHTSCIKLSINGKLIILDAGTGIIKVGTELLEKNCPVNAVMLFSHSHLDHIQGLPFFKPTYQENTNLYMYGTKTQNAEFSSLLESVFYPTFPLKLTEMPANISINNIEENQAIVLYPDKTEPEIINKKSNADIRDAVLITCTKSNAHPKDGVMLYKISCNGKSLVYATDIEEIPTEKTRFIEFAENTDLLIHDAQYTKEDYVSKKGYGHSTFEMAIENAKLAKAKKLIFFHLNPEYNDKFLDSLKEKLDLDNKNTIIAYEGLEIDLV